MIDDTKLSWEIKSKINEAMNSRRYGRVAEIYEQIGEFKEALNYYYHSLSFGQALQVAKTHMPEKIDEVYETAARTLLNGTYYEIEQRIKPLFYDKRAREIRDKLFRENIEVAEQKRNFRTAARWCEKIEDFDRAVQDYMMGGWEVDAAEIYERQGQFMKAAECYKEHGSYPNKVAACYEKAGELRKAAETLGGKYAEGVYKKMGDIESLKKSCEERCSNLDMFIDDLVKEAQDGPIENEIARRHITRLLNERFQHSVLEGLFPTIPDKEDLTDILDEAYSDEESRKKLKQIATSGTRFYTTRWTSSATDNFGESESGTTDHLDTEIENILPCKIYVLGAYFLAKDNWKDFDYKEKERVQDNLENILKYGLWKGVHYD